MNARTLLSLLAAGAVVAPATAQVTGLAAHYKLDEMSGTAVLDSSGNALDGYYTPGCTLGQPGAHSGTATSVDFDELQLAHGVVQNGLPLSDMTSDLSVSAWVYPETDGVHAVMRIFGNNDTAWSCARSTTGLTFTTRWIQDYLIAATVPLGQWTHVAFVFDANYDVTFYVDGVNIGTVTGGAPASAPGPDWLIGSLNNSVEFWDGMLDDIQVYEGTLTDSDVGFLFAHPGATIGGSVGTAYCFGDGSGTACPCGNLNDGSLLEAGCANGQYPSGARLTAMGLPSLGADSLVLIAEHSENSQSGLFFQANNDLSPGNLWGDGLQCAGGQLKRLGVRFSDANGYSDTSAWTTPISVKAGNVMAGDTKYYQLWYRNPFQSPCGNEFNASNGYAITWLP